MVVDASVWVSWLVPADVNNAVSQRWLRQQFQDPAFVPVVPTLALVEVTSAVARRTGLTVDGEQAMAAVGQLLVSRSSRSISCWPTKPDVLAPG